MLWGGGRGGETGQVEEKLRGIKSEEEDNNDIPRCSHYIIAGRLQPSLETSPLDQKLSIKYRGVFILMSWRSCFQDDVFIVFVIVCVYGVRYGVVVMVKSIPECWSLHDSVQQWRCTACCTERFLLTSVKCWGWGLSVVAGDGGDTETMTELGQGASSNIIPHLIIQIITQKCSTHNRAKHFFN